MNISIIIFCYNERDNLLNVFNETLCFLNSFSKDFEILIVDDGSNDGTTDVCKEIESKMPFVRVIYHKKNLGIGMALRNGYSCAKNDYICAIPGDGQFDIKELFTVKPFDESVFYSFYRTQTNYSGYRRTLTWLNRLFNQHFLAIYLRDVNWIKVYKKEHFNLVKPKLSSSLIESEICAKLYKQKILPIEIPSKYLSRKTGKAKGGNWKTLKKAIFETIKLWWVVTNFKPNQ